MRSKGPNGVVQLREHPLTLNSLAAKSAPEPSMLMLATETLTVGEVNVN
jgi:hypothetical protein